MREIRVCKPGRNEKLAENAVRRLQFNADGTRVLAWVAWEYRYETRRYGANTVVRAHDLATGENRALDEEWAANFAAFQGEPVVSRDSRFVVFEYEDWKHDEGYAADVVDLTRPQEPGVALVMGTGMTGGFAFAADGSALYAARNTRNQTDHTAEVVRTSIQADPPPVRFKTTTNPFTGQPMRVPVQRKYRWSLIATLPRGEAGTAIALSSDARLAAVGTNGGSLHVVDIKKKRVLFQSKWRGQKVRDRVGYRVGFHPNGEWVAMLANGRLFVTPLKTGSGKEWQTKTTLGYLHDFAYHPAGHTLAVVDAEGRARYLDPLTGAVKQEFRWKRGPLYSIAFAPDGLTCAVGAGGGRVVLWDVDE